MEAVVVVVFAFALVVPCAMWVGFVLSILWGWFLVPLGLPPIGVAHAIGIALVVGMFHRNTTKTKDGDSIYALCVIVLGPLLALGAGYVVKGFM